MTKLYIVFVTGWVLGWIFSWRLNNWAIKRRLQRMADQVMEEYLKGKEV